MSRSKRDILDTEAMLTRLTNLLVEHDNREGSDYWIGRARGDAESLRRISMTLRRWHELECGDSNDYCSQTIVRGTRKRVSQPGERPAKFEFIYDDAGKPYMETHYHRGEVTARYIPVVDRETGARKRLANIMARYPALTAYVQTDPRGCALYILKPGDVPEGADVSSYYSRGLAVFQ